MLASDARRQASLSDQWSRRQLGRGAVGCVPGADVMRDHQRRLYQPMTDRAAFERPFDVTGPWHTETTVLLFENIEEGSRGRPDDLYAAVLHAAVDVQVPAGNYGHAVLRARIEQPLPRR